MATITTSVANVTGITPKYYDNSTELTTFNYNTTTPEPETIHVKTYVFPFLETGGKFFTFLS